MIRSPAIRSSPPVQSLPVIHDTFFRALMDEPGVAVALLREHLPAEVAALLAPDAPELLDAHFGVARRPLHCGTSAPQPGRPALQGPCPCGRRGLHLRPAGAQE